MGGRGRLGISSYAGPGSGRLGRLWCWGADCSGVRAGLRAGESAVRVFGRPSLRWSAARALDPADAPGDRSAGAPGRSLPGVADHLAPRSGLSAGRRGPRLPMRQVRRQSRLGPHLVGSAGQPKLRPSDPGRSLGSRGSGPPDPGLFRRQPTLRATQCRRSVGSRGPGPPGPGRSVGSARSRPPDAVVLSAAEAQALRSGPGRSEGVEAWFVRCGRSVGNHPRPPIRPRPFHRHPVWSRPLG